MTFSLFRAPNSWTGRSASVLVAWRLQPKTTDSSAPLQLLAFRRCVGRKGICRDFGRIYDDFPVLAAVCRWSEDDWSSSRRRALHLNGFTRSAVPRPGDNCENCGEHNASRDDLNAAIHSIESHLAARFYIVKFASRVAAHSKMFRRSELFTTRGVQIAARLGIKYSTCATKCYRLNGTVVAYSHNDVPT